MPIYPVSATFIPIHSLHISDHSRNILVLNAIILLLLLWLCSRIKFSHMHKWRPFGDKTGVVDNQMRQRRLLSREPRLPSLTFSLCRSQWCAKYFFQNSILFWKYKIVFYFVFLKYSYQCILFCIFKILFFKYFVIFKIIFWKYFLQRPNWRQTYQW